MKRNQKGTAQAWEDRSHDWASDEEAQTDPRMQAPLQLVDGPSGVECSKQSGMFRVDHTRERHDGNDRRARNEDGEAPNHRELRHASDPHCIRHVGAFVGRRAESASDTTAAGYGHAQA